MWSHKPCFVTVNLWSLLCSVGSQHEGVTSYRSMRVFWPWEETHKGTTLLPSVHIFLQTSNSSQPADFQVQWKLLVWFYFSHLWCGCSQLCLLHHPGLWTSKLHFRLTGLPIFPSPLKEDNPDRKTFVSFCLSNLLFWGSVLCHAGLLFIFLPSCIQIWEKAVLVIEVLDHLSSHSLG